MPNNVHLTLVILIQTIIILSCIILLFQVFKAHRISISKTHLESTFDSIDDPLAIISDEYNIMRANKGYVILVDENFQQVIGKKCYSVLRGRNSPCEDCLMQQVLKTGKKQYVENSKHPTIPTHRTISLTFYPFSEKGQLRKTIVEHIRDTTELEYLKDNLEKQNRILSDTTTVLRRAQKEIDDELDLARQVQQSTLPQNSPKFRGLKLAVTYHPIEAVGGDLYDYIHFEQDRLGIFIGDASGHGLPSALVSTISKMSLYSHTKTVSDPQTLLQLLNNDLIGNLKTGHYLTCFWGIFDKQDNSLLYVRAGHPMPIVIRVTGEVIKLDAFGMFTGILEKPVFEQRKFHFRKGDRCYLFTDGIFEVVDHSKKEFVIVGFKEFINVLIEANKKPFEEIIPHIKKQLSSFRYDDDYTLILFEVTEDRPQDISESLPGFSPSEDISIITCRDISETEDKLVTMFTTMEQKGYGESDRRYLGLSINELVSNAFVHGNKNDPTKSVTIAYTIYDKHVKVGIVDEGEGFRIDNMPDPTNIEKLNLEGGRGIFLVRKYADEIGQNKKGNGVYLIRKKRTLS